MGMLATAMFVSVFAFGAQIFGWDDSEGRIQLALFMAFIFGILAGYRARG